MNTCCTITCICCDIKILLFPRKGTKFPKMLWDSNEELNGTLQVRLDYLQGKSVSSSTASTEVVTELKY